MFAWRRSISKVLCFQIEVSILPVPKRLFDRLLESRKIPERSASAVILATNRCLRQIAMAVTMETIALAVKLRVLGIGKSSGMQAVRSIEWHLHPKKDSFVIPYFREEIASFVHASVMQR